MEASRNMPATRTPVLHPLAYALAPIAQDPLAAQAGVLAHTRRMEGLSQAARADICRISPRQYARYERGLAPLPRARYMDLYQHAAIHLIQRRPANTAGRDFLIGDLHGHGRLLISMLQNLGFDPGCDRAFSVGDLADHGPESLATLRLLRAPWFHAVCGNHEDMLLDYTQRMYGYGDPDTGHPFFRNGGRWLWQLSDDERDEWTTQLAPRIALLPHILIVGSGAQRYHIVHAELDGPARRITDDALDDIAQTGRCAVPNEAVEGYGHGASWRMRLLWGRGLVGSRVALDAPEALSPTFCGHTVVAAVYRQAGHIFLDTGAKKLGESPQAQLTIGCIPHGVVQDFHVIAQRALPTLPAQ